MDSMLFPFINLTSLFLLLLFVASLAWAAIQEWKEATHPMTPTSPSKSAIIKTVYFYVVSLISLMMVVFSTADLVNIALRTWIFPKADREEYKQMPCAFQYPTTPDMKAEDRDRMIKQCEATQLSDEERLSIRRQRDTVRDISFLVIGIPLFAYHWRTIRKESKEDHETSKK